jgi:hypothetical protein
MPCQDYASFQFIDATEGVVLVAVICDGAGSAAHADVGAWLAAKTMIELVDLHFQGAGTMRDIDRVRARIWVEQVAETLSVDAVANGRAVRDYACTLLVAIVGETSAAFVQVGDGAMVISRGDEEDWSYLFWPQHGEFANTTNFVVSRDVGDLLEFAYVPERLEEVALFSDGLENLVLHQATRTVHEPFFRRMIEPVRNAAELGLSEPLSRDLSAFLASPRVCERTDDDKSLILASRLIPA